MIHLFKLPKKERDFIKKNLKTIKYVIGDGEKIMIINQNCKYYQYTSLCRNFIIEFVDDYGYDLMVNNKFRNNTMVKYVKDEYKDFVDEFVFINKNKNYTLIKTINELPEYIKHNLINVVGIIKTKKFKTELHRQFSQTIKKNVIKTNNTIFDF